MTGSTAPLGLAKGTWPLTAGLVTIPVTAPAEGFDPPRMSCMKNDNVWWRSILVTVVLVAAAGAVATEVTLDTGVSTRSDASGATAGVTGASLSRIRAEMAQGMARARKRKDMALNGAEMSIWFAMRLGGPKALKGYLMIGEGLLW